MIITFFSNYYNHHQKALCDEWYALLGDGFTFVETMPMEDFRSQMGWGEEDPPYLLRTYESAENYKEISWYSYFTGVSGGYKIKIPIE